MTDRPPTPKLADMLQEFEIDNNKLQKYRDIFIDELKKGCSKETQDSSSLKCYVTYVQDLPDDNVSGKFLALDLGGTNFRVLCVKLAKTYLDMKSKKFALSEAVMRSSGDKLFDHIADCLYQFTTEHKINNDNLPLGFTFSFPCEQRGLEVGILKQWTKGFSCPGVEGKNVVELLRQAIERKKGLTIDVVAVLNDTTGTLMSCAWKKSNAKIGLIIGTGTNACYVEKVENVTKFEGDTTKPIVVINCESGAFGSGGQVDFVRTKWDKDLDAESINPGVNIMEKMISGMYLGEFVRRLLVTAVERQFIFEGVATEKLKKSGSFESKYVSDIEGDLPGQHDHARKVLNTLGYGSPTEQDCVDLHYACFIAWQRAGRMVSAQMAALLNHMDYKDVTIGVDGSLYRFHPGFADLMNKKIRELTDPSIQFKCVLAEDGSGRGAALVAAVARSGRNVRVSGDDAVDDGGDDGGVDGGGAVFSKRPGDGTFESEATERMDDKPREGTEDKASRSMEAKPSEGMEDKPRGDMEELSGDEGQAKRGKMKDDDVATGKKDEEELSDGETKEQKEERKMTEKMEDKPRGDMEELPGDEGQVKRGKMEDDDVATDKKDEEELSDGETKEHKEERKMTEKMEDKPREGMEDKASRSMEAKPSEGMEDKPRGDMEELSGDEGQVKRGKMEDDDVATDKKDKEELSDGETKGKTKSILKKTVDQDEPKGEMDYKNESEVKEGSFITPEEDRLDKTAVDDEDDKKKKRKHKRKSKKSDEGTSEESEEEPKEIKKTDTYKDLKMTSESERVSDTEREKEREEGREKGDEKDKAALEKTKGSKGTVDEDEKGKEEEEPEEIKKKDTYKDLRMRSESEQVSDTEREKEREEEREKGDEKDKAALEKAKGSKGTVDEDEKGKEEKDEEDKDDALKKLGLEKQKGSSKDLDGETEENKESMEHRKNKDDEDKEKDKNEEEDKIKTKEEDVDKNNDDDMDKNKEKDEKGNNKYSGDGEGKGKSGLSESEDDKSSKEDADKDEENEDEKVEGEKREQKKSKDEDKENKAKKDKKDKDDDADSKGEKDKDKDKKDKDKGKDKDGTDKEKGGDSADDDKNSGDNDEGKDNSKQDKKDEKSSDKENEDESEKDVDEDKELVYNENKSRDMQRIKYCDIKCVEYHYYLYINFLSFGITRKIPCMQI